MNFEMVNQVSKIQRSKVMLKLGCLVFGNSKFIFKYCLAFYTDFLIGILIVSKRNV